MYFYLILQIPNSTNATLLLNEKSFVEIQN